jgi:2-C-methyl-D-erythritol 2,4-cyclodiphosphate synthase
VRIGQGYDVHAFEAGRALVLGGVPFEGETGLAGHSDADVLTHSVADALLGAAALGDIGSHFPSTDERWRNADSIEILKAVGKMVLAARFAIVNVDATVVCERPKVAPRLHEMRARIAVALGIEAGQVSVKATTTDSLGSVGRGEGIAAMTVALLTERL